MINFVIAAAPRSGTAWAANWLNTELSLCLHDPFWEYETKDLDNFPTTKRFGISCTGVALFPKWLDKKHCRKVVLHRDFREINKSLDGLGLPHLEWKWEEHLKAIDGLHVDWRSLFSNPEPIWRHLLPDIPFDAERHRQLVKFNVQMEFENIRPNKAKVQRLLKRAGL